MQKKKKQSKAAAEANKRTVATLNIYHQPISITFLSFFLAYQSTNKQNVRMTNLQNFPSRISSTILSEKNKPVDG